jgi:hypothetical protein
VIGKHIEPNGEDISFDYFGGGFYTLSDSSITQPLYYFRRTSAQNLPPPQRLVDAGAVWKYLDNGTDQGTSWRNIGFNDAAWKTGQGQFGYGNSGHEFTLLSYGPNPLKKYITTYFRTTFVVPNAPCITGLTLRLLVEDGAAVYLNGLPLFNFQIPPNPLYNTLATGLTSTNLVDTWQSFSLAPTFLIPGTNTLAVELHQTAITNIDTIFDCQLLATTSTNSLFTAAGFRSNNFQVSFCGPLDSTIALQSSPNLLIWTNLTSLVLTNGAATYSDSDATNSPRRFYRLVR